MRTRTRFPAFPFRRLALLCTALCVGLPGLSAPAAADDGAAEMVELINEERSERGTPLVRACADLAAVAQRWSEALARSGELSHNPDRQRQVSGWRALAENVGYGESVGRVHEAFMESARHRDNRMSERYTEVGVGVATGDQRVWVAEVFRRPARPGACAHVRGSRAGSGTPVGRDIAPACSGAPHARFSDVAGAHRPAVDCLVWYGISDGVSAARFAPQRELSRGQAASLLTRTLQTAGVDLPAPRSQGFGDVDESVHADAINQLTAAGILEGVSSDRFDPDEPVRRGQLATLLVRVAEQVTDGPLTGRSSSFKDVGRAHASAINAAAANGLVNGRSGETFDPSGPVTRDHAATFVARLLSLLAGEGQVRPPE